MFPGAVLASPAAFRDCKSLTTPPPAPAGQASDQNFRRLPFKAVPTSVTTWSRVCQLGADHAVTLVVQVSLLVCRGGLCVDVRPAMRQRDAIQVPGHD